MPPLDLQALADRYLTGISLRQLGAEVGLSHRTTRYHLLKLKSYRKMVTQILLARISAAQASCSITRTRSNQRRLKLCLAMLRQKRPAIYKRMVERLKPKRCSECSKPIQARRSAGMWIWSCEWCGKGGIERCLVL
jgi:predicted RNA-binding Zn-ribbon protein involved in translation (DUF1610 family)